MLCLFSLPVLARAQITRRFYNPNQIVLRNVSNQTVSFTVRPANSASQTSITSWTTLSLAPKEMKVLPGRGLEQVIILKTANQRAFTYRLIPGKTYEIFWSTPRSVFDIALAK